MMHELVSGYCDVYWLLKEHEKPPLSSSTINLEDFSEEELVSCWANFMTALEQLQHLQLLDVLCSSAVVQTIHKKVAGFIQEKALLDYESSILPSIEDQLMSILMTWLREMPGFLRTRSEGFWESQLKYFSYKTYAEVRISKLFEIIVEFPESKPALMELKVALNYVNCWNTLVSSLSQSFKQRLLHPGASTVDIIAQYFSTIRSFFILDPSGHMVDKVCKPIQKYLSTREDTVRCFVSSLVEDSGGELAEEMLTVTDDTEGGVKTSKEYSQWFPDPVGIMPGGTSKNQESLDIISVLVGIFGNADFFIKEYCNLLADRLLNSLSYDISTEVCNLELLKKRFGEPKLHLCDVMLKDVAESRRINTGVCKHMSNPVFPVEAFVLSHCFWPSFRKETLLLPPAITEIFEEYTRHYQSLKGLRTLEWRTGAGLVDLEVELGEEVREFTVSPPRAVIALHFQDKS
jgi:anaphase-promoting complex subunit 2